MIKNRTPFLSNYKNQETYAINSLLIKLGIISSHKENILNKPNQKKYNIVRISKQGKRKYISYKELNDFNHGFKLYILRTSKGIITSQTALKNQLGGELLFAIS
jgi:ribosomal protein S8